MTVWYVHRREDNSIASAHAEPMPGYAEEALDDAESTEMQAYLALVNASPTAGKDSHDALIERRARALDRKGTLEAQIEAMNLRIGG